MTSHLNNESVKNGETALLEWKNYPARERPVTGVVLFVAVGAISIFAIAFTGMFLLGILALLLMLGAFATFLFPVKYRVTGTGVKVSTLFGDQKREFKNFRRVVREKNGALISPFSRPHSLDNVRGFYIRKESRPEELWTVLENVIRPENAGGEQQ